MEEEENGWETWRRSWSLVRDQQLDYVNEIHPEGGEGHHLNIHLSPESKDISVSNGDNDDPVSAAVSLVVGSARQGVVALCTNVARIIRQNNRLSQRVTELEQQVAAYENSSTRSANSIPGCCNTCSSSSHVAAESSNVLPELQVSHRCGSAPPSVHTNSLKFQKLHPKDEAAGFMHIEKKCSSCSQQNTRTEDSACALKNCSKSEPKFIHNDSVRKSDIVPGWSYSSTRSLNFRPNLPPASFVRRRYNTISLRRVSRSRKERFRSFCSINNNNGSSSSCNQKDQCDTSSAKNSTSFLTVAEVHSQPPLKSLQLNDENDARTLLARKLSSVMQIDEPSPRKNSDAGSVSHGDGSHSEVKPQEICVPHPLSGCECVVCARLAADPSCDLYVLTTEEGALLTQGSQVLVRGERVGTVLYLGHRKHPDTQPVQNDDCHQVVTPAPVPSQLCGDQSFFSSSSDSSSYAEMRPIGVTVRLWPPDEGEVFVSLTDVICQLDDDIGVDDALYVSGSDCEYVDDIENGSSTIPPREITAHLQPCKEEDKDIQNIYFNESSSDSSCVSDNTTHSLGELSLLGAEVGNDDPDFREDSDFGLASQLEPEDTESARRKEDTVDIETDSEEHLLNSTLMCERVEEGSIHHSCGDKTMKPKISLYDTCDSAISLTFNQKSQDTESLGDPSTCSKHNGEPLDFGDTWDSGCYEIPEQGKHDSSKGFCALDSKKIDIECAVMQNLHNIHSCECMQMELDKNGMNEGDKILATKTTHNPKHRHLECHCREDLDMVFNLLATNKQNFGDRKLRNGSTTEAKTKSLNKRLTKKTSEEFVKEFLKDMDVLSSGCYPLDDSLAEYTEV